MSEQTDGPSFAVTLFALGWAVCGMSGAFVTFALDPKQQILATPLWIEWIIIFGTVIGVADPTTENDVPEQRSGETNARYTLRVWLLIHVLLLKTPFIGVARVPSAARRAVSWLRATPGGDSE